VSYGPVAALAVVALLRPRRRGWELLPIPIALLVLCVQSAVFFGHSSYRAYVDPLLVVLASGAVAAGRERTPP
jgi:predicted ABC-type sugar transport system permease subunit